MLVVDLLKVAQARESFFTSWYMREPLIACYTIAVLLLIPFLLIAINVDERLLNGINIWIKPLKFNVAIVFYLGTLTWYCGWIDSRFKKKIIYRLYLHVLCGTLLLMLPWLYGAAILGESSHYNRTHPVLAPTYALMGIVSTVFTTATVVVAVLIAVSKHSALKPFFRYAVVWSLCISFVFTVFMAGELASLDSHWIGGSQTDKNGLWGFGWSRDGGDLRVAHFFALHAMHFIPLFALLHTADMSLKRSHFAAAVLSLAYSTFIVFVYLQAKNGKPFLALA